MDLLYTGKRVLVQAVSLLWIKFLLSGISLNDLDLINEEFCASMERQDTGKIRTAP